MSEQTNFMYGVFDSENPGLQKTQDPRSTAQRRKATPIYSGVLAYFPDALAAIAEVSRLGNDQHNPGQPLHWAREKSTDQMDSAIRHMIDSKKNRFDIDGGRHLAKTAWRILAQLQLEIENEGKTDRLSLFESIKHGSTEHQSWLKSAITAYNNNQPIPKVTQ